MNFITKEVEYDSFAEEIRRHNADIIGLNEVYDQCDSGKFPAQVKILADLEIHSLQKVFFIF